MKALEKKYKFKKINTISEFERRKLYQEQQKNEQNIINSKKFFGKIKIRKVISLRNMITPFAQKEKIKIKKSKRDSIDILQKRKYNFDLSKPVYSDNIPNFLMTKTTDFKNTMNTNITREMNKINQIKNNNRFKTLIRNNGINSKKLLQSKKYNNNFGCDKHIITSKSCPDLAAETKYTSDNKNLKTMNESQKNQFNQSNKFKEKQSVLSTLEFSNIKRNQEKVQKKYKYSRENILKSFSDVNRRSYIVKDKNYLIYRKKYFFVKDPYIIGIDNEEKLKQKVKKFNENSLFLLLKENQKLFSQIGRIVEKGKFSEKFRDPLNNSFDKELEEERKIKEKNIIKLNILSGVDLLKEMDKEIEKRKIVKKTTKNKPILFSLKRFIIKKMEYLRHLQINFKEIINNYKMSKTAFSYPQTEYLIMAIRNKNYDDCCDILDKYKHIVLDFDFFHFTPLHWAAKLNFFEIIPKLISYGAPVNEQNLWGDTPLHISVTQKYYETSIFLLLYSASPFIKNSSNQKPFDCNNDVQLNTMYKKIRDIHLKNFCSRQKNIYENIQKEFSNFVIFEFSNLLNPVALSLIKGLKSNYL